MSRKCPICGKWQLAINIESGRYWCPKDGYVILDRKPAKCGSALTHGKRN